MEIVEERIGNDINDLLYNIHNTNWGVAHELLKQRRIPTNRTISARTKLKNRKAITILYEKKLKKRLKKVIK